MIMGWFKKKKSNLMFDAIQASLDKEKAREKDYHSIVQEVIIKTLGKEYISSLSKDNNNQYFIMTFLIRKVYKANFRENGSYFELRGDRSDMLNRIYNLAELGDFLRDFYGDDLKIPD